jgi:sugar phosphate isomerase/epimerase
MQAQPKEDELLQLPGKGDLDFAPLLEVLRTNQYAGWTEIFMHPFPRGIPILADLNLAAEELQNAKNYLETRLR